MTELAGYYDGVGVRLLERGDLKKYQSLKIIVTDDFVDNDKILLHEGSEEKYINKALTEYAAKTLLSFQKPGIGNGDYKKDLTEMLEKKYESID